MAGDGGGDPRAQRRKILILLGFIESALDCSITSASIRSSAAPSSPTGAAFTASV
jgi:hypothetical protein